MKKTFKNNYRNVFIVSPTESILTKQGNRHPSLAAYFTKKGFPIIYYSSNFYHAEKRKFSAKEIAKAQEEIDYDLNIINCIGYYSNVSVRRVINNILLAITTFFCVLRRCNSKDIIILPSRPVEFILLFSIIKRIKKCEIVLDVEDIWPDALIIDNKTKKWIFDFYCNIQLKNSIKHYNKFLTISPSYAEWINKYKGNDEIRFIPLGYEKERWENIEYQFSEKKNIIEFGLIAVLQLQVDILPFIKVIANNNKYRLTIIGEDGKGQRYNEVINYINENDVKNVNFVGRVPKNEVQNYLKNIDVGVSPIISRLLPNKFFDYLVCNLPMISIGNEDMQFMVDKYNIGWTCENELEAIKNCIELVDFDKINEIGKNILRVKEQFEREKINKEIFKFIIQ